MTELWHYSDTLADSIIKSAISFIQNSTKPRNQIVPFGTFRSYNSTIIDEIPSENFDYLTITNILSTIQKFTSIVSISYNQSFNLQFNIPGNNTYNLPEQEKIGQYIIKDMKVDKFPKWLERKKENFDNRLAMVPISQISSTSKENAESVYNSRAVSAEELKKALEKVLVCEEIEKYFDFQDSDNDIDSQEEKTKLEINKNVPIKEANLRKNYCTEKESDNIKLVEYDVIEKSINFDSLESTLTLESKTDSNFEEDKKFGYTTNAESEKLSTLKDSIEIITRPPVEVDVLKLTEYEELEKSINFESLESVVTFESKTDSNFEEKANELPLLVPILTNRERNLSEQFGNVQNIINKFEKENIVRRESIFYIGDSDSENGSISQPRVFFVTPPSRSTDSTNISYEAADENKFKNLLYSLTERCSRCWKGENVTTALSILSLAATLGNFLRLPRMVYFHGGGIFLLIYILLTLVFGIPLTFLEIGLGQFSQHGAVKLWRAVNLFRGVGYAKALLSFVLAVSYSTEIASALALMAYSLNGPLPFAECEVLPTASENGLIAVLPQSQEKGEQCLLETVLASVMEQPMWFGIQFAFLIVIWVSVLICVMKRTVTYRKCMYFIFPGFFALIAALLVQNSSNNSAETAINKLFVFKWTALGDIQVWYYAMVQMFFSLQIGFGNISTCSGRIYPKTNAFWTAICMVVSNLAMGIASVILVYLWLGSLNSLNLNFPVPEAFVLSLIYQVSTSTSVVWACLAYIIVFLAGLSSLIAFTYTVLVAAAVETKRRWRWRHINGFICLTACLLAAFCIIPGKFSMAHVIEHYMVSHGVIALTILELVGFAVIYGCSNLYNDFEFVIGSKLSSVWKSLWLVTPCVLIVVEVCGFCLLPLNREYGHFKDSEWEIYLGWALYGTIWVVILLCAIYQVYIQVDYNIAQKFVSALKPSRNWGPVDPIYRHCWVQWRNRYQATGARDFTLKRRGTRDYTHHARTSTPAKIDCSTDSLQWPRSRH